MLNFMELKFLFLSLVFRIFGQLMTLMSNDTRSLE